MKITRLQDAMVSRPDPLIFRSFAYILAATVVGSENMLGSTFFGLFATILAVLVAGYIFPARVPRNAVRITIVGLLNRVDRTRWSIRLSLAIMMIGAVTVFNSFVGGDLLGLEYSFFLIAVFVASLLFGIPVALITWLLSFLVVYYFVVPPKDSFEIGSLKDVEDLIGYFYLGLAMLAVAALFRASSFENAHQMRNAPPESSRGV